MSDHLCRHCQEDPVRANGLCHACRIYRLRAIKEGRGPQLPPDKVLLHRWQARDDRARRQWFFSELERRLAER